MKATVASRRGRQCSLRMGADFRDVRDKGLPDIWMTAIEKTVFPLFL